MKWGYSGQYSVNLDVKGGGGGGLVHPNFFGNFDFELAVGPSGRTCGNFSGGF